MGDHTPLDLQELGEVTPPDAVRRAVRRFRRRVFTTGAVVAVAVLSLAGGVTWGLVTHRTLAEKVEGAPGMDVGATFVEDGSVTVLERVARLDEGVAIHFHLAAPETPATSAYSYRLPDVREFHDTGSRRVHDFYYVIAPPPDGLVEARLLVHGRCPSSSGGPFCGDPPEPVAAFTIDLRELGVPETIWRG